MEAISPVFEVKALLGVERSLAGRRWTARLDGVSEAVALAIAQRHGLGDALARVLAGRGVSCDEAESFLDPRLRTLLPDPFVLVDMAKAAATLADAVERGAVIGVFGDYDVDGAASAALLAEFLAQAGGWSCRNPR